MAAGNASKARYKSLNIVDMIDGRFVVVVDVQTLQSSAGTKVR